MRIKRFFEHIVEASYHRTSSWRPTNLQDHKAIQQIDQKLRDRLLEIFPSLRKPIETENAFTSKTKLINGKSIERVDIDILQSDDEWFFVRIIYNGTITSWRGHSYFKCDQFDGLVDCIKNEVIEKSKQE